MNEKSFFRLFHSKKLFNFAWWYNDDIYDEGKKHWNQFVDRETRLKEEEKDRNGKMFDKKCSTKTFDIYFSNIVKVEIDKRHSWNLVVPGKFLVHYGNAFSILSNPGVSNSEWLAGRMRLKERSRGLHWKKWKNYLQFFL